MTDEQTLIAKDARRFWDDLELKEWKAIVRTRIEKERAEKR